MSSIIPTIIIPGGLHTDIIGAGVPDIVGKGELSYGGSFQIGPGGKSRNIAEMISVLTGRDGRSDRAGTIQFSRSGIRQVEKEELDLNIIV